MNFLIGMTDPELDQPKYRLYAFVADSRYVPRALARQCWASTGHSGIAVQGAVPPQPDASLDDNVERIHLDDIRVVDKLHQYLYPVYLISTLLDVINL